MAVPALRSEVILAVADHEFDAAIAGFSFAMWVDDPTASWHLEIECERREIDGSSWEPHLGDDGVEARRPKLHRVGGFAVADGLTGALEFEEPAFTLYQHDHLPVEDVTMRVGDLVSHGVEFRLTGTANLFDSKYPGPRGHAGVVKITRIGDVAGTDRGRIGLFSYEDWLCSESAS